MKNLIAIALLASTSFAANGEDFFLKNSNHFWEGLDSIRFKQSDKEVLDILKKNLPKIQKYAYRWKFYDKLSVWVDSISVEDWTNATSNPSRYIRNLRYNVSMPRDSLKAYMFGFKKIYIGTEKEKLMCFSFYTGPNEVYKNVKSKYTKTESVTGLFHISLNYKKFKESYLRYVNEYVGYGRKCYEYEYNCDETNQHPNEHTIKTKDKDVNIDWSKDGNLLSIVYYFDYSSLRDAFSNNVMEWERKNSLKYPNLD